MISASLFAGLQQYLLFNMAPRSVFEAPHFWRLSWQQCYWEFSRESFESFQLSIWLSSGKLCLQQRVALQLSCDPLASVRITYLSCMAQSSFGGLQGREGARQMSPCLHTCCFRCGAAFREDTRHVGVRAKQVKERRGVPGPPTTEATVGRAVPLWQQVFFAKLLQKDFWVQCGSNRTTVTPRYFWRIFGEMLSDVS